VSSPWTLIIPQWIPVAGPTMGNRGRARCHRRWTAEKAAETSGTCLPGSALLLGLSSLIQRRIAQCGRCRSGHQYEPSGTDVCGWPGLIVVRVPV